MSLARQLVGAWQSLDTLTYEYSIEADPDLMEGGESTAYRILWSHLSIGDTAWTETAVSWNPNGFSGAGLDAYEQSRPYSVAGDSLFLPADEVTMALHVSVRGDTLVLQLPAPARQRLRYARTEPLEVDSGLVGFWSGFSEPDAAGVPAEIGFRFSADGTYQDGWGDPQGRFARVGPYLLLENHEMAGALTDALPEGIQHTFFDAIPAEIHFREALPDGLVLGPPDAPLVLYRRR